MPSIDTNELVKFNGLVQQLKQRMNMVTAEEWNHMWNVLITQSNDNAKVLEDIRDFVAGRDVGVINLPDNFTSIVDYIQKSAGNVLVSSEDEPENLDFYIKIET
jgi:hypothetical protein